MRLESDKTTRWTFALNDRHLLLPNVSINLPLSTHLMASCYSAILLIQRISVLLTGRFLNRYR